MGGKFPHKKCIGENVLLHRKQPGEEMHRIPNK